MQTDMKIHPSLSHFFTNDLFIYLLLVLLCEANRSYPIKFNQSIPDITLFAWNPLICPIHANTERAQLIQQFNLVKPNLLVSFLRKVGRGPGRTHRVKKQHERAHVLRITCISRMYIHRSNRKTWVEEWRSNLSKVRRSESIARRPVTQANTLRQIGRNNNDVIRRTQPRLAD